jgi:predicted transcriptional regulator
MTFFLFLKKNLFKESFINDTAVYNTMGRKKGLHYFFLRQKPVMLLVNLSKDNKLRYTSILAKEVDCTYSHTVKIVKMLKEYGLVEFSKKGRLKTIELTPMGKDIATTLAKTVYLFEKADNK